MTRALVHWFMLAIMLTACGALRQKSVSAPASDPRRAELQTAYNQRLTALKAAADQTTGWPSATDCDGTLWAGEAAAAGDDQVQLQLAEWAPGEIHRRPATSGECYPAGSASTVSRDMLVGYMTGMFAKRDSAALERLKAFGSAHAWVMGVGPLADTFLTPDGQGLLERGIKALGGSAGGLGQLTQEFCAPQTDYQLHVQTLGVLLDAAESGGTNEGCAGQVAAAARANPKDALVQAAAGVFSGDESAATALLLDPGYQPPSYVRGAPTYADVHWLYAAHVVLSHTTE